jgi:hypothetical protein
MALELAKSASSMAWLGAIFLWEKIQGCCPGKFYNSVTVCFGNLKISDFEH